MATLAEVARNRKNALKELQKKSLTLDAKQEIVEREVKRLLVRKRSIPEAADIQRVISQITAVSSALSDMLMKCRDILAMFRT